MNTWLYETIQSVEKYDSKLFFYINHSLAEPKLDAIMRLLSGQNIWFLILVLISLWFLKNRKIRFTKYMAYIAITLLSTDILCFSSYQTQGCKATPLLSI